MYPTICLVTVSDAKFKANSGDTLPGGGVTTTFKPKVNIISIALAGEWAFLPKGKVNPFVGVDA